MFSAASPESETLAPLFVIEYPTAKG